MKEEKEIQRKLIQLFLKELESENQIPKDVDLVLLNKALEKNITSVVDLKKLLS